MPKGRVTSVGETAVSQPTEPNTAMPSAPTGPQPWTPPGVGAPPVQAAPFDPRQAVGLPQPGHAPQLHQPQHSHHPHAAPHTPHPVAVHAPAPVQAPIQGSAHIHQAAPGAAPLPPQGYPPTPQPYAQAKAQPHSQSQAQPHAQPPYAPAMPQADVHAPAWAQAPQGAAPAFAPPIPNPVPHPAAGPGMAAPDAAPKSLLARLKPPRAAEAAGVPALPAGDTPAASNARTPFLLGLLTGIAVMFLGGQLLGGDDTPAPAYAPDPYASSAQDGAADQTSDSTFLDNALAETTSP